MIKLEMTKRAMRTSIAVCVIAMVAACGGGDSDGGLSTAMSVEATRANASAPVVGTELAKLYMAGAKGFSSTANNPVHDWTYRAYCESGHLPGSAQAPTINVPAGGAKLMDNAWIFGSVNNTLVVRTSSGDLLVFDPQATAADMQAQVISQMSAAGLDPRRITYVFVGNETAAAYEGVNLIVRSYAPAAKVVATRPAVDAFSARTARGKSPSVPQRVDVVVTAAVDQDQGSKLIPIDGDLNVVAMLTPGATLGQMSVIVPVQHQGVTQRLLVWSGNEAAQGRRDVYGSSTYFVEGFVVSQGATAWFNTQAYRGALLADYQQLRADPNYLGNLVMGTEGVRRWLGIFASCNRALAQRSST